MKQTIPVQEPRYEVLALFTASMLGSSLMLMSTGTLLPFFEDAFHIGRAQLGLVLSVQMGGGMLMTAAAGALTDRFGDKAVVLWSGLLMGSALILAGAIPNFTWMLFWLVLYGFGYAAVTPSGSHAILFFFKKEDRGLAMGLRQCGVPLAGLIGALVLPGIALYSGYRWALVAAGIAAGGTCIIASIFYREPKELQGEKISVRGLFAEMLVIARDYRLILITLTSMILLSAQMAIMGFFAISLVREAGYPISLAVTIFAVTQAAALLGRMSWGWASDHIFRGSRAVPLAVASLITAIAALSFSMVTGQTPLALVVVIAAVLGFAGEGWLGVAVIAMAEIGGEEHSGSALGVGLTGIYIAGFLAPTIFGALAQADSFSFVWRFMALLQVVGIAPALLASSVIRKRARA